MRSNLVARADAISRLLDGLALKDKRTAFPKHIDHIIVGRFLKCLGDVVDALNLLTIDLINNLVAELGRVGIDWIRQDVAENDNLFALPVNMSGNEIIKIEMQSEIIRIVFRHEVGIDRLEDQPAEDDKPWFFVISLRLQGRMATGASAES